VRQKGRKVPPPTPPIDPAVIVAERDQALLSMDEQQIRAYFRKYNGWDMSPSKDVFWLAIHKARTATRSLPMEARQESKRWLLARGSPSMDEGEVIV
jgi:hypothetical protein